MNTRTYTVIFMQMIGGSLPSAQASVPNFYRQYKDKRKAYRAMSKYYAETGNEAFLVRGDKRDSHKRKQSNQTIPLTTLPLL
jgi:hypothetical protein